MSENVVVEPESPSSPQTLVVDGLLLVLEYYLVKWLIAKWQEYEKGKGPPTTRCLGLQPPPWPTGQYAYAVVFRINFDDYQKQMSNAISRNANYCIFRLRAINVGYNPEWEGWNWHVVVNAKGGGIGATADNMSYLWNVKCPAKHFKKWTIQGTEYSGDPDDQINWNNVCGCQCPSYPCGCSGTDVPVIECAFGGENQYGIFYNFWRNYNNNYVTPVTACPCTGECSPNSGNTNTNCKDKSLTCGPHGN